MTDQRTQMHFLKALLPTLFSSLLSAGLLAAVGAQAAIPPPQAPSLSDRLDGIRSRVVDMEGQLALSLREKEAARVNLQTLRSLMQLQAQETELGRQRLSELERTVNELEQRKVLLQEKISIERRHARGALISIHRSLNESPRSIHLAQGEELEAPRRKVLGNLVGRNLRELEALRIDLEDAKLLEQKIAEERAQLDWLFHDLEERRGILELNRSIQADLLQKRQAERVAQLQNYQKLKSAEREVGRLIRDFNARRELERTAEGERLGAAWGQPTVKTVAPGVVPFESLQGRLPLPVQGARLVAGFGRNLDSESGLQVFRKGVELSVPPSAQVKSVHGGKVAYAGEMAGFGRIVIVDHGSHFYTLYGRLGSLTKKEGDLISGGEAVGLSDASGGELYFEVRARNLPVNPLNWVVASVR